MLKKLMNIEKKDDLIKKLTALALIITLTIANFLLVGKESYALFEITESENLSNIDTIITNELEKYIKINNVGVLVQFSNNISTTKEDDDTGERQIEIQIPEINGQLPANDSNVNIINYCDMKYSKKYENGKLNIYLENNEFLSKFKIVCIYPEEAFENNVEKEISTTLKISNKEIINVKNKIELLEEKGQITNINVFGDTIYKGLMYKNKTNENYETSYQERGKIETSYILGNPIVYSESTSKFIENQDKEIDAETYFDETKFSMSNLKKTLGDNFEVIVSDGNSQYILNKETETDEDKDTLIIKYTEKINAITINISDVISTEEPISFENQKTMITNNTNELIIKNISKLESEYSINGNSGIITTYLKEPYLKARIELEDNKTQITALSDNETNIVITLLTNQEDRELLYNNSILKIKMPENVKVKELKNATIAGGDGNLEINSYNVDNEGNIIVTLNGEQKNYIETIYNTQITVETILEVNKLIANTQDRFIIEATNKDSENKYEYNSNLIDITNDSNLLTYLKISNFDDNENIIEIYNEGEEGKQVDYSNILGKNVKVDVAIINNYSIDLKNVSVSTSAKYTNKKGQVMNLDINEQGETENYSGTNIDIDTVTGKSITLNLNLPNEINYNEIIDIELEVKYSIEGKEYSKNLKGTLYIKDDSTSEIDTQIEKITANTTAKLADGTILKEGDSVYEGETITYTITIKNNTDEDIKNVNAKATVTNGNIYDLKGEERTNSVVYEGVQIEYKYAELDTNEKIFDTIETLGKEPIVLTYEAVVRQVEGGEYIESLIDIKSDDIETNSKIMNKIQKADLKINIARRLTETCDVYSTLVLDTCIKVQNISDNNLEDVTLKVYINDGLLWKENKNIYVYNEEYTEKLDIANIESYDKENGIVTIKINKLDKNSIINIQFDPDVDSIPLNKEKENVSVYVVANETYQSNLLTKEVLQAELGLSVTQITNIENDKVLKHGDDVNITVTIKNSGIKSDYIEIFDKIPDGFDIQEAKSNYTGEIKIYNENELYYYTYIESNSEIVLEIKLKFDSTKTLKETGTNIVKVTHNYNTIESNEINFKFNLNYIDDEEETDPDIPIDPDIPVDPDPDEPIEPENTFEISGQAWIDENKNGQKEKDEKLLSGIKVKILDSENNNNFLKDKEGNIIEIITNENGIYKFTDIPKGKYLVIFEYDSKQYELTDYRKEGILEDINSDVLNYILIEDNDTKKVGITELINLNKNISNIDIGLTYMPKFDLKIDKNITKVIVQTSVGTTVAEYQGTKFAKSEIKRQYLNGSTLIVEYSIKVSNEGEIAGYANKIVDNMPTDMQFKSELNESWYMGTDGKLYNTSLANTEIEVNNSKELKLILVKNMTNNNTGYNINTAEIEKYSNAKEIVDSNLDNNKDSAKMLVSPSTGTMLAYTIIITTILGIMGIGIYLIKKILF